MRGVQISFLKKNDSDVDKPGVPREKKTENFPSNNLKFIQLRLNSFSIPCL